ncbi:MAG: redox-regulated ATPase YchF, partial [Polyangiales bacterium]
EAANYPFCTIDPNVGVVPVPDPRFDALVELYQPAKQVEATVEFVDIAGLVKGASKGEGKGNAFLSNIREADAIAHVVRCFEDDNVMHVDGHVDPAADIETIETELLLKDLETVQKRYERAQRGAKGQDPVEKKAVGLCEKLLAMFDRGEPASGLEPNDEDERRVLAEMMLLSRKPVFYVANVGEPQLADADNDARVATVREVAERFGRVGSTSRSDAGGPRTGQGRERARPVVVISAAIEAEIMQLPPEERGEFLESVGLEEPGLHQMIRTGYEMLDLITFFTAGPKEVHAWTVRRGTKAPQAAGKIHTDMERGFIRAEVMRSQDLVELGSEAAVRAAGKMQIEGKEYVVRDGDVLHIRFNV